MGMLWCEFTKRITEQLVQQQQQQQQDGQRQHQYEKWHIGRTIAGTTTGTRAY